MPRDDLRCNKCGQLRKHCKCPADSGGSDQRLVRCPQCDGFGKLATFGNNGKLELPCDFCKGLGKVASIHLLWRTQGRSMKEYRIKNLEISLREAARKFGYDPSNLSKMERGVIKPVPVYGNFST